MHITHSTKCSQNTKKQLQDNLIDKRIEDKVYGARMFFGMYPCIVREEI
jgi:hypothetical protein